MHVAVTLVGRCVRRMAEAPRDGCVIATFRRSLYIRDTSGAIGCIGMPGLGAGPLNALCDRWPDESVATGEPTRWSGTNLEIAGQCFDFGTAALWQPASIPRPADLAGSLALLKDVAARDRPARGFGRMIVALIDGSQWTSDDPFARAGGDGVRRLADWLAAPTGEPPSAVETLIGLGPGLTPAGDDALGGALITARALGRAGLADRLAAWVMPRARERTSDISFAHLAAAAEGQGAAALHDTLSALARCARTDLVAGLHHVDAIGHSSGWDALTGATALLVALTRS